jgi:acetyl-CoA C-acetyltransferase
MRKVAVIGAGHSVWGVRKATFRDLIQEAGKAAFDSVDNKNLKPKDIEGFVLGSVFPERTAFQSHVAPLAAEVLGIQPKYDARVEHMCQSGSVAIRDAYLAIAAGVVDIAMVVGAEKMNIPNLPKSLEEKKNKLNAEEIFINMMAGIDREWEGCFGLTAPPMFALAAQTHIRIYGTTEEQLAMISVKNHKFSSKNPYAHFKNVVSVEECLNSKLIASPLKLYDCCPVTDGAAAVILVAADRAKEYTDKPIYILGFGQKIWNFFLSNIYENYAEWPGLRIAGENAYKMAGIKPEDVDVAEVHDCFTIAELIAYEELGFCKKGEGGKFIESGQSDLGGKVPVNVDGGLIGKGHPLGATGVSQCCEMFKQLRGEAGERQVKDAKVGLTHNNSGPGEHIVIIYGKEA